MTSRLMVNFITELPKSLNRFITGYNWKFNHYATSTISS